MKKSALLLLISFLIYHSSLFAKTDVDPIRQVHIDANGWNVDNPRGKIKIRFIKNEDKSDTTNRPKGFFGKLRNVVNMLLDASDNPPFKVEIIREKTKKN